ncbi:MAG: ATP-binding cassette domain-containing protein [Treponema sp.]|nr:ATP-binding cassette domain-containing protein [Treponema sp.]
MFFSIDKGEIRGYIGPNGAGKSTTLKMLSGVLIPDAGGTATVPYQTLPGIMREHWRDGANPRRYGLQRG